MRAMVNNQDYQGYWSEWSEEFIWETENGTFQAGSFLSGFVYAFRIKCL